MALLDEVGAGYVKAVRTPRTPKCLFRRRRRNISVGIRAIRGKECRRRFYFRVFRAFRGRKSRCRRRNISVGIRAI